jgi:hypothetical protein
MPDKSVTLSQSQMKTRPKIGDVVGDILCGEKLAIALDFIAYLKENKLNLSWSSANTWHLKHNGKVVLFIRMTGAEYFTHRNNIEDGSWLISPPFDIKHDYADFSTDKAFKEAVWRNVNYCAACIKCKPGNSYNILGKNFEGVCNSVVAFVNPTLEDVDCVKKLIEYKISLPEIHGTPKKPLLDTKTDGLVRLDNKSYIKDITGTNGVNAAKLFDLKYAMFHSKSDCEVFFSTAEPVILMMYGLVTYKEDKLPSGWSLFGKNNDDDSWVQLDSQTRTAVFSEPMVFYCEKAFEIATRNIYQHYKLNFEGEGLYFLSQVHFYIQ